MIFTGIHSIVKWVKVSKHVFCSILYLKHKTHVNLNKYKTNKNKIKSRKQDKVSNKLLCSIVLKDSLKDNHVMQHK